MKKLLILFFAVSVMAYAEDIYLKDGTIYRNAQIVETNETDYSVKINNFLTTIPKDKVLKIGEIPFDPSRSTLVFPPNYSTDIKKPFVSNSHFIVVGLLSAVIAWDSFSESSDIGDRIDEMEELKFNTDDLESMKMRKTVLGIAGVIGAIVSFAVSFNVLEVHGTSDGVSLSYRF